MTTNLVENNDNKEWDYLCPQFCDFNATETTDQLQQIDHFFQVDHESEDNRSTYGVEESQTSSETPLNGNKSQLNSIKTVFQVITDDKNDYKYETPPQNKENFEDEEEDNEVFYSTKKYLSVEKKRSYKLRSTPMRTLQYNGITPLRETRISSKKKKKSSKSKQEMVTTEQLFAMKRFLESLTDEGITGTQTESIPTEEMTKNMTQEINDIQTQESNVLKELNVDSNEKLIESVVNGTDFNEIFENEKENGLQTESAESVVNKRESYVIEKVVKALKSVTLVSPIKSAKTTQSIKKRRRGTPVRRSTVSSIGRSVGSSNRKVSAQSVVSRLYSSVKKPQNEYKSMAELLREFETKPRGYDRSRSVDLKGCGQRSRSSSVSSLTNPKSPKLHSVLRHRPTPRQTEDIIASQIKKYSFKANPIRKKLFDSAFASGIPRVKSSKAPTKAIEMHFLTDKRNEIRSAKHSTNEDRPLNESKFVFKANPMPAFRSFQKMQTKSEKKSTAFKPFSFDHKIQELVAKKRSHSEDIH